MAVYDVPARELIDAVASDLEKKFNIEKPVFVEYVKTGSHKERAPDQENWFYVRMASMLYRVFKEEVVGVGCLRSYYGGKKRRGVKPPIFRKASGKIIRVGLQNLEKAGLIKKGVKGRVITPKGVSYLTKKSNEVKKIVADKVKLATEKRLQDLQDAEKRRLLAEKQAKDKQAAMQKQPRRDANAPKQARPEIKSDGKVQEQKKEK
ncbi:MAG: 30S ribosomal protein S19e [Candidatus Diapherotrites archaeon CG08_land_8_20_14_0_20_34_12]|nr:MAG: 30S ribosomal protein S19e [Candidatus Diapherotrites archaeon CG08_land_8_20_14_0_20_34_12]